MNINQNDYKFEISLETTELVLLKAIISEVKTKVEVYDCDDKMEHDKCVNTLDQWNKTLSEMDKSKCEGIQDTIIKDCLSSK